MLCKKFTDLNSVERTEFVGKLVHIIQNDDLYFMAAESMIRHADQNKVFEGIVINPKSLTTNEESKT